MTAGAQVDSPQKPSILAFLFRDYLSLLCFLFPTVNWVLFVAATFNLLPGDSADSQSKSTFFFWLAVATTVVFLPLLYIRIRSLLYLFRDGIPTVARVTSVWLIKDRGRVDYEYHFQGQLYHGGMAITRSDHTIALAEGQEITVLVHPDKPSKSIVPGVFG